MVRFFVAVALAGCASHASTGPSWPKAAETDKDGGESISPRESRAVAAAIEKDEEPVKPVAAPEAKPAATAAAAPDIGAPAAAPSAPIDESLTTEDVIIEIDE